MDSGLAPLLIGTDKGSTALGAPLSALDFQVRPNPRSARPVQGTVVGDQALDVSRDRRKLRALNFNLQENGFQSRDLPSQQST